MSKLKVILSYSRHIILPFIFIFIFIDYSSSQILLIGDSYTSVNSLASNLEILLNSTNKHIKVYPITFDGENWDNQLMRSNRRSLIKSTIDSNKIDLIILQSISFVSPTCYSKTNLALHNFNLLNIKKSIPIYLCDDFYLSSSFPQYFCSKDSNNEVICNIFKNKTELLTFSNNIKDQLLETNKSLKICNNGEQRSIIQNSIGLELLQLDEWGHPTILLQKIKAIWIYYCIYSDEIEKSIILKYLRQEIDDDIILDKIINQLNSN